MHQTLKRARDDLKKCQQSTLPPIDSFRAFKRHYTKATEQAFRVNMSVVHPRAQAKLPKLVAEMDAE